MPAPVNGSVRKVISFDAETWVTLKVLSQDTMLSLQELMDEAVRDLLSKRGRPVLLRDALEKSAGAAPKRKAKRMTGKTRS